MIALSALIGVSCEQKTETIEMLVYIGTPGISTPKNSSVLGDEFKRKYANLLSNGYGTLSTNGMRQLYNLGLSLREEYPDLLGGGLDSNQYVSFTEKSMAASLSASCFYAAFNKSSAPLDIGKQSFDKLYPFTRDQTKTANLDARVNFSSALPPTIDVQSVSHSEDDGELFADEFRERCKPVGSNYKFAHRQGFEEAGKSVFNLSAELSYLNKNLPLQLSENTINKLPLLQAAYVMEPLHSIEYGTAEGLEPQLKRSYQYFSKIYGLASVAQFGDKWEDYYKWLGSPILTDVIALFNMAAKSSKPMGRKLTSYIGDYLTFNSIIQALQGLNKACFVRVAEQPEGDIGSCGPLALVTSNYVLELVKRDREYFVRTRFEGEYIDICNTGGAPGADMFECSLKQWADTVNKRIYPDWRDLCYKQDQIHDTEAAILGVVVLLLGIFVLLAAAVLVTLALFFKKSPHDEEIGEADPSSPKNKEFAHSSSSEDFSMDPDDRDHAFVRVKRG